MAALTLLAGAAGANPSPRAAKPRWPAAFDKALAQAQVPASAVAVLVVDVNGQRAPRLSHRAGEAMNPASTIKLVTTYAALDALGPDFRWQTRVIMDGRINDGLLEGNMVVRGGGETLRRVAARGGAWWHGVARGKVG